MPFQSQAQERWAFGTGQPFAKKWADITDQKRLPKRKRKTNKRHKKKASRKHSRRMARR